LLNLRILHGGWSSDELAHIDRAARFLRTTGIRVEADSGTTDEGDPWFVFCDVESDEIIVHFARLSGTYIACHPFHSGALRGPLLADVIDQFLQIFRGLRPASADAHSTPAA